MSLYSSEDILRSMSSQRKTILQRIMQIEAEIKHIKTNKNYSDLRKNLNILENNRTGGMVIRVSSPDDLETFIEVRRNSEQMKAIVVQYKAKIGEYQLKINSLSRERVGLEKKLFS